MSMPDQMSRQPRRPLPILPYDGSTATPLLMAIAVMCFLATLGTISVLMINQAAGQWTSGLSRSATVQLPPASASISEDDGPDSQVARALAVLSGAPGIVAAVPLPRAEAAALLEPWLGSGNLGLELPIPQLIDVTIDTDQPPDFDALDAARRGDVPGATLDDPSRWNDRILVFAHLWRGLSFAALGLIGLCTAAIVTFATRASLAARQDIVDVLHLIGARDDYIARQFQRAFLKIGLIGSILGVAFGVLSILDAGMITTSLLGEGAGPLIPNWTLEWTVVFPLALIPAAAAGVIALTTQITVVRTIAQSL